MQWRPSMAQHEKLDRILHLRAKKYMWSIHKSDHGSLGHCDTKCALPILIIHSRSLPTFPLDSQSVCHAYTNICAKMPHHSLQTSPHSLPRIRLLSIPPSSSHIAIGASHRRVRMNCTTAAHSNLTFALPFAMSSFNLPLVTVFA